MLTMFLNLIIRLKPKMMHECWIQMCSDAAATIWCWLWSSPLHSRCTPRPGGRCGPSGSWPVCRSTGSSSPCPSRWAAPQLHLEYYWSIRHVCCTALRAGSRKCAQSNVNKSNKSRLCKIWFYSLDTGTHLAGDLFNKFIFNPILALEVT